jgi:hypothetical protein
MPPTDTVAQASPFAGSRSIRSGSESQQNC